MMQYSTEAAENVQIVYIEQPDLRLANGADKLYGVLTSLIHATARLFVLDMRKVRHIDSAVVVGILRVHEYLRKGNKSVQVYGVSDPHCDSVMRLTGLHNVVGVSRAPHPRLMEVSAGEGI